MIHMVLVMTEILGGILLLFGACIAVLAIGKLFSNLLDKIGFVDWFLD